VGAGFGEVDEEDEVGSVNSLRNREGELEVPSSEVDGELE
jgi:hypothetical protein